MAFFGGGGASATAEVSIYGRSVYGIGSSTPSITVADFSSGSSSNVTFGNGKALIAADCIATSQTRQFPSNTIKFTPFFFHKITNVYKFIVYVIQPAAQRLLHCGFYTSNSNGLPETLVANSNYEFTIGTAIGTNRAIVRQYSSAIEIPKGIVWHYSWTDGNVEMMEANTIKNMPYANLHGWQAVSSSNYYSLNYTKTYNATPVSTLTQSFGAGSTQDTFFYSNNSPPSHFVGIEVDP